MYDRILVPLDGSEASETALVFVEHLANQHVRLLRIEQNEYLAVSPLMTGMYVDWENPDPEQVRDELKSVAERLRNRGWIVEIEIRSGDAAEEIIACAEDADLVVMTTHGRGAAGRVIFGSTADRVARHGTTPTLLLRVGSDPIEQVDPSRVVVPLDGSELAEQALPEAERLARVLGVPLHLVRAVGA